METQKHITDTYSATVTDTSAETPSPKAGTVRRFLKAAAKVLGVFLLFVAETVLLVAIALYGVMYVVAKGPSPAAGKLFVLSVRETSAIGFLADLFYTEEEIAAMENPDVEAEYIETDASLIQLPTQPEQPDDPAQPTDPAGPQPDAWGLIDEDGDGIIIDPVKGPGYSGYMMVVLDPSRVVLGCYPDTFHTQGYSLAGLAKGFGAVAGINGGGFIDEGGTGSGSEPDSIVVYKGEVYFSDRGVHNGFVGLDRDNILHVGWFTEGELRRRNIRYGACFGPILVVNGEVREGLSGGLNPRTAIGQRADGAILMLVIDGRQVSSIGASYQDLADIFIRYGAVNACNLDGGSSSLMYYNGEYINSSASVVGIRPIPNAFLVLPKNE